MPFHLQIDITPAPSHGDRASDQIKDLRRAGPGIEGICRGRQA